MKYLIGILFALYIGSVVLSIINSNYTGMLGWLCALLMLFNYTMAKYN